MTEKVLFWTLGLAVLLYLAFVEVYSYVVRQRFSPVFRHYPQGPTL